MTLTNLTEAVSAIGYGSSVDDRTLLISSANMALSELHLRIPIIKKVRHNIRSITPSVYYSQIDCKSGVPLILPLSGRAFSMRLLGKGTYCIDDGGAVTAVQFDAGTNGKVVREFIYNGGSIEFWGGFAFSVCDFAVFDQLLSTELEDIPLYSPTTVYNLREIYGDFLSFVSPVTDKNGRVVEKCSLHDGQMEIDSAYNGQVIITYRKLHPPISYLDEEQDNLKIIDIPAEYENMLVYLTAYYYWRMEDEAKSDFYREKYESMVSMVENTYHSIEPAYTNINGWA